MEIFSPGSGTGAIYELARIIDTFRKELPEDKLTFNVGLVGGGASAKLDEDRIRLEATGKTNIIPETAIARGDLRAISREQIDRVKAEGQKSILVVVNKAARRGDPHFLSLKVE